MLRTIIKAVFLLLVLTTFTGVANGESKLISSDSIDGISIGAPADKIFTIFQKPYRITDKKKPHSVRTISVYKENRRIVVFSVDDKERVLFIDIYGTYMTPQGIGCGSTIEAAIKAYGPASLSPTDEGYLLYFEKLKNIIFLLDNNDVPKDLRNIPDDVFEQKDQDRILKHKKIHISSIKISKADL